MAEAQSFPANRSESRKLARLGFCVTANFSHAIARRLSMALAPGEGNWPKMSFCLVASTTSRKRFPMRGNSTRYSMARSNQHFYRVLMHGEPDEARRCRGRIRPRAHRYREPNARFLPLKRCCKASSRICRVFCPSAVTFTSSTMLFIYV